MQMTDAGTVRPPSPDSSIGSRVTATGSGTDSARILARRSPVSPASSASSKNDQSGSGTSAPTAGRASLTASPLGSGRASMNTILATLLGRRPAAA